MFSLVYPVFPAVDAVQFPDGHAADFILGSLLGLRPAHDCQWWWKRRVTFCRRDGWTLTNG